MHQLVQSYLPLTFYHWVPSAAGKGRMASAKGVIRDSSGAICPSFAQLLSAVSCVIVLEEQAGMLAMSISSGHGFSLLLYWNQSFSLLSFSVEAHFLQTPTHTKPQRKVCIHLVHSFTKVHDTITVNRLLINFINIERKVK